MKRILTITLCAYFIIVMLSACGGGGEWEEAVTAPDYSGFETTGELSGGGALYEANLSAVNVAMDGDDAVLTLSFISNSRFSGSGTEREVGNPPKFTVYGLEDPERIVIDINSLSYWDYTRELDTGASDNILGTFNYSPEQGGEFRLYIELAHGVAYAVEESGSDVILTLRPLAEAAAQSPDGTEPVKAIDVTEGEKAAEGSAFHIVANAYRDYCSGRISCPEMTPVLADDRKNVMLISCGFSSKGEAETLMKEILSREASAVPADWSIVELEENALPSYSEEMEYMAAFDVYPARINGEATALDVAVADGLSLAVTPENDGVLYAKHISLYEAGGGAIEYEELWLQRFNGEAQELVSFQFDTIESAKYSPDGRRLAVLERSGESAHLYIFDVDSRDLISDLSSLGFGDTVSAYCFDSMGGCIYSIGGSGAIVVNQYDFNVPAESKRHTVVDDKGADESSLGFYGGEVYFCETTLDSGATMYRVKPEGGLRREYLKADSFEFSRDGRYLAYADNKTDVTMESTQPPEFRVLDLETGESRLVTGDFLVYTFTWSLDATKLYYFENKLTGSAGEESEGESAANDSANDPFPYTLWCYDMATGASTEEADLSSTAILASGDAGRVYLNYTDPETLGDVVRATYVLDIK